MSASKNLFDALAHLPTSVPSEPLPLASWQPALSGDIDIEIRADGRWYHEGEPIERQALVKLFSRILRREGDEYFLVTPVEKWRLRVQEVPFIAVSLEVERAREQALRFKTNCDDEVTLSATHPLRLQQTPQGPALFLAVRDGLEAKLHRNVYYQLAELAEEGPSGWYVTSAGERFVIG